MWYAHEGTDDYDSLIFSSKGLFSIYSKMVFEALRATDPSKILSASDANGATLKHDWYSRDHLSLPSGPTCQIHNFDILFYLWAHDF